MKFTFVLNQAGVVRCGLIGRVTLPELCVLDYLGGWFRLPKAKRTVVDGRTFVWVNYSHAVEELPLLFNPQATLATRKNQLTRLIQNLRATGLIETVKVGRHLFLRPSELGASLVNSREHSVIKSAATVTPPDDGTVTSTRDDTITGKRDDLPAAIINEPTISEETIKKPIPLNPPKGERDCSTVDILSSQAKEILAAYPRKVGEPSALRAIRAVIPRFGYAHVLARTQAYANATKSADPRFIPYPVKFFREHRFNDAPSTWVRPTFSPQVDRVIEKSKYTTSTNKL